ncbi:MAG: trimeric intracellular cation channel family protein [Pseudomonadota bacterium]|nr:trimeric intracellular cation channel family protein [Pseudomonadota bacterium]
MTINWNSFTYAISIAGTVAFAVTAVLAIHSRSDIDIVGAIILGLITATGGGTLRDVILGVPAFWSQDLIYIWVATGSSIAALYGRSFFSHRYLFGLMLYLDGLGVALFGIQGTEKAWALGFGLPVAPIIMGVTTAIGGGIMRDILAGRTTLLMRHEIYATPVILSSTAFIILLNYFPDYRVFGSFICILGAFALRAGAIHWNLSMPAFAIRARNENE